MSHRDTVRTKPWFLEPGVLPAIRDRLEYLKKLSMKQAHELDDLVDKREAARTAYEDAKDNISRLRSDIESTASMVADYEAMVKEAEENESGDAS